MPALGLGSCALAPWTVCGRVDESALTVTRHTPLLPVCGLVDPSRGLLTATGTDEYARALGRPRRLRSRSTGRRETRRDRHGSRYRSRVASLVTALLLLTARSLGTGVGNLGRVAGTTRKLSLLPAITATLG